MHSYPQIRRALAGRPFYVHEQKMQEMLVFLEIKLAGGSSAPEALASIRATNAAAASRASQSSGRGGAIAVLPIYGMIMHRQMADISGGSIGTSTNKLSAALRQMVADPGVSSIVLDVDSPGGDVDGVDELASQIYAARKQKKITAVSNCLCASAAYYLASQASEIVVSPSSLTGSIGVYVMHEDDSAMLDQMGVKLELIKFGENKAEGNSLGPLTDSARAHLQETVDFYGNSFERAVARGRGISQNEVHNRFGQGRVFYAKTAVRLGMADRVGTLDDALSTLASSRQPTLSAMRHQLAMARVGGHVYSQSERERVFARMRHQLLVEGADVATPKRSNVATPKRSNKRALNGEDCTCDCEPCTSDNCEGCNCKDCSCEGCACETATAQAKQLKTAEFAYMRRQLDIARA